MSYSDDGWYKTLADWSQYSHEYIEITQSDKATDYGEIFLLPSVQGHQDETNIPCDRCGAKCHVYGASTSSEAEGGV